MSHFIQRLVSANNPISDLVDRSTRRGKTCGDGESHVLSRGQSLK